MSTRRGIVCATLGALCAVRISAAAAQTEGGLTAPQRLVSFGDAAEWRSLPSDGVRLTLRGDSGTIGRALRFDFDFQGHAGYAVARHSLALPPLPEHWAITLFVRGEMRPNTLELKFVDATGQNVWWIRRPELSVTRGWTRLRFRQSDLSFAWGPLGGGAPRDIAALEIAVTAGRGGAGWVAFDELTVVSLPPLVADAMRPDVSASSTAAGTSPSAVLPVDFATPPRAAWAGAGSNDRRRSSGWRSANDGDQTLSLDFRGLRDLSGLVIEWDELDWAVDYDVQSSDDGRAWITARSVRAGAGGRRFVHLPAVEAAWLRLLLHRSSRGLGYHIRSIRILPASAAPTRSAFLERVAEASGAGEWPRQLTGQQSYWTVIGLPRDPRDALVSEDGAVESHPGSFSVEPFILADGHLLTWRNGAVAHTLDRGSLPIPSVRRTTADLSLEVTAFAYGPPQGGHSTVWLRYRVVNTLDRPRAVRLFAAVRPVQVNPPWQFLGIPGGAADVRALHWDGRALLVNDSDAVVPITLPSAVGVTAFDAGPIVEFLRAGRLPPAFRVSDSTGFASGALMWRLDLRRRDSADVWVALPAAGDSVAAAGRLQSRSAATANAVGVARLEGARTMWTAELGRSAVSFPGTGAALARTLRTALADVLINARGPAIQPGTRSYRRSWIRDGALTSAALLRLGHEADVRAFLDWYLPYLFADGRTPCCVDERGADPVPENDSDGELLFLAAEYWRVTHDDSTVERGWGQLARTALHLDSLRRSRRGDAYRAPDSLFVFGLLPPSISHEGYSSKPAYSYWDDWWGVRGMTDAALLARVAGDTTRARRFAASASEFRADVLASVARALTVHHITFLPGAAELGDFDPTSSTIALEPVQALPDLPPAVVRSTFDSAWMTFTDRRAGRTRWEAYTPYEWRQVGAFIRLGEPERAHALAAWLLATRRPLEWNEWSELVWRDPRTPKFIGDMPHGWVASDFVRATLDFVAYERERDSTLVVGAGIPLNWARAAGGVTARGIRTWWGTLELTVRSHAKSVSVRVTGVRPPGGVEVRAPYGRSPRGVTVNGHPAVATDRGRAVVVRAPALVEFVY